MKNDPVSSETTFFVRMRGPKEGEMEGKKRKVLADGTNQALVSTRSLETEVNATLEH